MGAGNICANLAIVLHITGEGTSRYVCVGIAMDKNVSKVPEFNGTNVVDINIEKVRFVGGEQFQDILGTIVGELLIVWDTAQGEQVID